MKKLKPFAHLYSDYILYSGQLEKERSLCPPSRQSFELSDWCNFNVSFYILHFGCDLTPAVEQLLRPQENVLFVRESDLIPQNGCETIEAS